MLPLITGQDVRTIRDWLNALADRIRRLEGAKPAMRSGGGSGMTGGGAIHAVAELLGTEADGYPLADIYKGEDIDALWHEDIKVKISNAGAFSDWAALTGVRFPVQFNVEMWEGHLPHIQGKFTGTTGENTVEATIELTNGEVTPTQTITILGGCAEDVSCAGLAWLNNGTWYGLISASGYAFGSGETPTDVIPYVDPTDGPSYLVPPAAGDWALVAEDGVLTWRRLGCDESSS